MDTNNLQHELLHWVTLATILDVLVEEYGFEELSDLVRVNCFLSNPSKQSCLKFLRKTEWARIQVQWLYVKTMRKKNRKKYSN